ncbi:MAG: hypothetical protein GEU99_16560 [Luteitalea sp.]|nr:hypothetical protein [Luteitalea sp.]
MAKKGGGRKKATTVGVETLRPGPRGVCLQESLHPVVAVLEERLRALTKLRGLYLQDRETVKQIDTARKIVAECRQRIAARACPPDYCVPFIARRRRSAAGKGRKT